MLSLKVSVLFLLRILVQCNVFLNSDCLLFLVMIDRFLWKNGFLVFILIILLKVFGLQNVEFVFIIRLIWLIFNFEVFRKLFKEKFKFGFWLFILLINCKDWIGLVLLKFCVLMILKFKLVVVRFIFFRVFRLLQKLVVGVFLIVILFSVFIVKVDWCWCLLIFCFFIFIVVIVMEFFESLIFIGFIVDFMRIFVFWYLMQENIIVNGGVVEVLKEKLLL